MYDITIAIISEKRKKVFGWFKLDEIAIFTLLVLLKVLLFMNDISHSAIIELLL